LVNLEDTIQGSLLGDINTAAGDMLCYARWLDGSEALLGSDQFGSDRKKSVPFRLRLRKEIKHPKV